MDAVEYFKIKGRMCAANDDEYCDSCPLAIDCFSKELKDPEEAVKIVKEWNEKHPGRTRQDAFLEMYPDVKTFKGAYAEPIILIKPCSLIKSYANESRCGKLDCLECRRLFWWEEVDAEVNELVRCGECKWRNDQGRCTYIAQIYPLVAANHFCGYGARKQ